MRRYWINFKGKQSGPLSIEQLSRMGVDNTAYVWHSGLDDWVKITKVPELNEMLKKMANGNVDVLAGDDENVASQAVDAESLSVPELPADGVPELPADEVPELPPHYMGPVENGMAGGPPPGGYYPQYASGGNAAPAVAEQPECPPSNLVWAIITTLCCCTPVGVVGIILACLTKKHYREGNYEKAEKFSEYGAWAVIASIILGLVTTPIVLYMSMVQSAG